MNAGGLISGCKEKSLASKDWREGNLRRTLDLTPSGPWQGAPSSPSSWVTLRLPGHKDCQENPQRQVLGSPTFSGSWGPLPSLKLLRSDCPSPRPPLLSGLSAEYKVKTQEGNQMTPQQIAPQKKSREAEPGHVYTMDKPLVCELQKIGFLDLFLFCFALGPDKHPLPLCLVTEASFLWFG